MSAFDLLDQVHVHDLLPPGQLAAVRALPEAHETDARALARVLCDRGYLTAYQVNLLFTGRGPELRVGSYRLLERLGAGGMGQVYKARRQADGRIVAIKVIRKEKLSSMQAMRRFHQEVQVATSLHHENIVETLDAGEVEGVHYLAMEYIDGIDLQRLVKEQGPLDVGRACEYARQTALGLLYAHEQGVVHRDIKPANLLLSGGKGTSPVVKILDMGLARPAEAFEGQLQLTRVGSVLGSPDYLAPEQARNARGVDPRADLYSLGCSLYFLLSGKPPFRAPNISDLILKHMVEEARPIREVRPDVPVWLESLLRRLMAKNPADRPATAAEVAAALAPSVPVLPPAPVAVPAVPIAPPVTLLPAPPEGPLIVSKRPRRKRRFTGWLTVSVAIGLGVLVVSGIVVGVLTLARPARLDPTGPDTLAREKDGKPKPKTPNLPQIPPGDRARIDVDGPHVAFRGHEGGVSALAVSPDGTMAASAGIKDRTVCVWDLVNRRLIRRFDKVGFPRIESLAFSPDRLGVYIAGRKNVQMGNSGTGEVRSLNRRGTYLSPDGRLALSISSQMGSRRLAILGLDNGVRIGQVETLPGTNPDVVFSGTSDRVLLRFGNTLQRVDLKGDKKAVQVVVPPNRPAPTAACFGMKPEELVVGCSDFRLRIFDLTAPATPREVGESQRGTIFCLALSQDGKRLLSAGITRTVHLTDLVTGKTLGRFAKHTGTVRRVTFLPDGKRALSAGDDGVVWLWNLPQSR